MKFLAVLLCCLCIGCTPVVVVSGTGLTVYAIKKHKGPITFAKDFLLFDKIKTHMIASDHKSLIYTVDLHVEKSNVYFFGRVKSDEEKAFLLQISQEVSGINKLIVDVDVKEPTSKIRKLLDGIITSQIDFLLMTASDVHFSAIYTKTIGGKVYIVSNAPEHQIDTITNISTKPYGVTNVVLYNDYVT